MKDTIGKVSQQCKIAAGLFWADYGVLGAQVEELEAGGVDWIHIEMRDGKYMDFGMPRGGYDIIEATRKHTDLELEVQLQMYRPGFDVFDQLADLGVNLITVPVETSMEMTMQSVSYITDKLNLKAGVWAWQGTPIHIFEQYMLDFIDIIEYESRAVFWERESGKTPHCMDMSIMPRNIKQMHSMVKNSGFEMSMEIMEDGGLNVGNVAEFIKQGMTVGEFSSPLLKGPEGKFQPGSGKIAEGVQALRRVMEEASNTYRTSTGLI